MSSGVTTAQLEGIIWPRYKEPADALANAAWNIAKVANPKMAMVQTPPNWFTEIFAIQAKALLNLAFSSPHPWVVMPEPIQGFTIVMYKTPRGALTPITQSKLQLRYHTFDQFNEFSQLVEKTLVKIIKGYMKANNGDVIELENDDGVIYVFPKAKMEKYLLQLGFAQEQIPRLLSVDDIESDFSSPD